MRKQTRIGSNPRFLTCLFVTFMVFSSRALAKSPLQGGRRVTAGESSNLVPPKLKGYRNANYNFLLKYPANWSSYQGFDGNGVSLYPPSKEKGPMRATVGVGGSVGQPSKSDESRPQTLEEDFESRLQALGVGPDPARKVAVTSKLHTTVKGLPAIVSTINFERSTPPSAWTTKEILIHTSDNAVTYHLSLMCHPDSFAVLVRAFDQIVSTFKISGPPS